MLAELNLPVDILWIQNTIGIWNNCATQHYALNDYFGQRRHMQRISTHES